MSFTDLIPFTKKSTALVPAEKNDEIVVHAGSGAISTGKPRGQAIQVRTKTLKINGKTYSVDPYQLMRMIKQVTQTVGEYKERDNPYSGYVIGALRKARGDMVSDLESHFNIHWQIDESTGGSIFYM